jgi:hypothetical protein
MTVLEKAICVVVLTLVAYAFVCAVIEDYRTLR